MPQVNGYEVREPGTETISAVYPVGTLTVASSATTAAASTDGVTSPAVAPASRGFNYIWNGATWDRQRKSSIYSRVASSAAAGNPAVLANKASDLKQFWGQCAGTAAYLQIYNKATAPVIGTDVPVLTFPIPANTVFSQVLVAEGAFFSTGISYAFTTDAAGTTGSAAAAITAFAIMGA